ncbi:MAG: hypothetical protein JOY54_16805 [Acidobacteriaceae bacterium]|nr:hypothetical protein [Acidobacteriaceae bacterium]
MTAIGLAVLALMVGVTAQMQTAPNAPLPDAQELKRRVMASMKASEKNLENYSCIVQDQIHELNPDGSVKKHRSSMKEQFFVNGVEIDHTLEKDGKPLTPGDAKKEQEHVDKEVKKYSDPKEADKSKTRDEKEVDLFLRALRLSNGSRVTREGRSTLVYDLSGDPAFHPKKVEERFAEALNGRIWIDEQSGMPVEVRFETTKDVKIGGGLLANLHKGFWLHLVQQREPDGVWITKSVDGSGDARAALFVHARFRFSEQLDKCHLFSVNTQQNVQPPAESPAPESEK